jgi:hypothetical protein
MKKNNLFKALLALIHVLSMTVTGSVLVIFASDEQPENVAGDVSGDGKVELLDLLLLRRYFANFDFDAGVTTDIAGGDFNADGAIDTKDIVEIREYLANCDFGGGNEPEGADNISAISPEAGSTVVLANDTIYSWHQSFDGTSATVPDVMHEDLYHPVPVTLKWECREDAYYYLVYLSDNEDLSDPMCFVANEPTLQVENLFVGTDYYWQVDAICGTQTLRSEIFEFSTALSPRTVTIEGVSNTRDIGGLPTADGNSIKQGMIYRGGKLENITANGKNTFLYELGIKTDLDLRTVGEGGAGVKSPVSDSLTYFIYDGRYYAGSYGKGIDTEEGKSIMADEIRVFANPDNYPIYIHCSLGRDRTGTLVMILQALCGVEQWDLYMDYEMSMFSVSGTLDNANPWAAITDTYAYINNNYSGDSFAEKTENYLLSIGITAEEIATIRSILIEEVK